MSFKVAQTFYINRDAVKYSEDAIITGVDVFVRSKPRAESNKSGIFKPGVTLMLLGVSGDDIPDVNKIISTSISYNQYDAIVATSDANTPTRFSFKEPTVLKTNTSYAIAISCDGDEDYVFWTCKEGENVVGTNSISAGATAKYVGKYYEHSTSSSSKWKPLNNVDLKFKVYCGTYSANTEINSLTRTYILPNSPTEYIVFDRYSPGTSSNWSKIENNEFVYQDTPVMYGTINVSSTNTNITCSNSINFSTLLKESQQSLQHIANTTPFIPQKSYIVLRNGTSQSSNVCVREVIDIVSNTQIVVDQLPTFTNNAASFSVTAAGKVKDVRSHLYTGRWWNGSTMTMHSNKKVDMLVLDKTNANSTVRFVNNMVQGINIHNGGTGYSNSSVLTISPAVNANTSNADNIRYIQAYANAVANVVTNGSGTITGVAIRNAGFGLLSNINISISGSGSGANLSANVGSILKTDKTRATVANTIVADIPSNMTIPKISVVKNQHHTLTMYNNLMYYTTPGKEHILNMLPIGYRKEFDANTNIENSETINDRSHVLASRSNEVRLSNNAVVLLANNFALNTGVKASSIIEVNVTSNNAYTLPAIESNSLYSYNYKINNDATNENRINGNAIAKHISKKVTFLENRTAEDMVIYLQAWKPKDTNIKVYVKLHNKADAEAFDDKDWTELELQSNNGSAFSTLDKNDILEYTYGIPKSPTVVNTIPGSAQLTLSSANVIGLSTTFTSSLAVGDIVKIYPKLFPAQSLVTTIESITNNTLLTLSDVVNNAVLVSGYNSIDLVGRIGPPEIGRPKSAWINATNSYICRYYDSNLGIHDGYNSYAIKIVLLSTYGNICPEIENIRAVGVSA